MSKRVYIAVTTTSAALGYKPLAYGANKAAVEAKAQEIISQSSTYAQTMRENLRIVSKTEAKRTFGIDYDNSEAFLGYEAARVS